MQDGELKVGEDLDEWRGGEEKPRRTACLRYRGRNKGDVFIVMGLKNCRLQIIIHGINTILKKIRFIHVQRKRTVSKCFEI